MTGFAFHELARVFPAFVAKYPEISVEIAVTDRIVDLVGENADIGIRSGKIENTSLVSRKIAEYERGLYASSSYLLKRGMPNAPEDLINHDCIVHASKQPYHWPFLINGKIIEFAIKSNLIVDNAETALQIALAGGGIARIGETLIVQAVRSGQLIPVLSKFHASDPISLSVVYPYGKQRMPKVRAFVDFLIAEFSVPPWSELHRP